MDEIKERGKLAGLMQSLSKYTPECLALVVGKSQPETQSYKIGPVKIFERLWQESGLKDILSDLLKPRQYEFDVERAIFLTVLHRICSGGSDGRRIGGEKDIKSKGWRI